MHTGMRLSGKFQKATSSGIFVSVQCGLLVKEYHSAPENWYILISACEISSYLVSGEAINDCVTLRIFIWFLRLLLSTLSSDQKMC
jgi:hypothetical protein